MPGRRQSTRANTLTKESMKKKSLPGCLFKRQSDRKTETKEWQGGIMRILLLLLLASCGRLAYLDTPALERIAEDAEEELIKTELKNDTGKDWEIRQ